jgi:hypothetical protein
MIRGMNRQQQGNLLMSSLPGPPTADVPRLREGPRGTPDRRHPGNVPVSVGVLSYAGQLNFDIVAEANVVPDLAAFAKGLADD